MGKRTVYLIHGFNVRDGGKSTTDHFHPLFAEAGYKVVELDYGFNWRLRVRLCSPGHAMLIAAMVKPNSIVVGHSNGCNIIYKAAQAGAVFRRAILINPALDADKTIKNAGSVQTWHSPDDPWTWVASFIPGSDWGDQGRVGYIGDNKRHVNFNNAHYFGDGMGHSEVLHDAHRYRTIFEHAIAGL